MPTATASPARPQQQQVQARPFVAAAHQHTERALTRTVGALTAAQQVQDSIDVPASGFLRSILLECTFTGGTLGAGVISADYPWNLLTNIALQDVNGTNIVGPIDGFGLWIVNLIGAFGANSNISSVPGFVGTINAKFYLRIPVEINSYDGLGTLANESTATQYKVTFAFNTIAAAFSTAPTTPPAGQVKIWTEAWTQPPAADSKGIPNALVPPMLGTGQFITSRTYAVTTVNDTTIQIARVGNLIRNIIIIARDGSGARNDAVFIDPVNFNWDTNQLQSYSQFIMNALLNEKMVGAVVTRPVGVFAIPFSAAGQLGALGADEKGQLWLPTSTATRLEFQGANVTAGSWQIIINDIAPIEVDLAARFSAPSTTGTYAS